MGLPVYDHKLYFDISEMFRNDANRMRIKEILSDKEAFYPQYMPDEKLSVNPSMRKRADIEKICRILTFEVYMRQINDPNSRPNQFGADNAALT